MILSVAKQGNARKGVVGNNFAGKTETDLENFTKILTTSTKRSLESRQA